MPPAIVPGITLGIVGHRADRIVDPAQVHARIRGMLAGVVEALQADGAQQPRLVSALAEGADRIAVEAALESGLSLDVVLPFPPEEYRTDFETSESRAAFDALLGQAESVLTLDGASDKRAPAYDAAGIAMLDNCDLLIAVWDGGPGRGRGGTRDVIDEAVRRAMPIVTISPDGADTVLRVPVPTPRQTIHLDDVPGRNVAALPDLVRKIVRLREHGEPDWLSASAPPARGWIYAAYPFLLKFVGVGRKKGRPQDGPINPPPQPLTPLHTSFEWWDNAANGAAKAFRSAVIVNFGLAALAVVLAVVSLLVGDAKWIFVAAEITTIGLLIANTWYATRHKWQERWLESREIAELLRVSILLRQVGIGRGVVDSETAGWSTRYVAALSRSVPPDTIDLSRPVVVAEGVLAEIADQASWNQGNARKMHLVAHRIERFGEVLFLTVLALSAVWLGLWFGEPHLAKALKYWLTALTAGLPAIASASYGIRIILDFEGIAGRSHKLASALNSALVSWSGSRKSAACLQALAVQGAEVMLGDLNSWRLLAEGRQLALPG